MSNMLVPFGVIEEHRYDAFHRYIYKQMSNALVPFGVVEERRYDTFYRLLQANEQRLSTIGSSTSAVTLHSIVFYQQVRSCCACNSERDRNLDNVEVRNPCTVARQMTCQAAVRVGCA